MQNGLFNCRAKNKIYFLNSVPSVYSLLCVKEETVNFECFDLIWRGEIIKQEPILQTELFKQLLNFFLFLYGIICYISNEILWGSIGHVTNSDIALRDRIIL